MSTVIREPQRILIAYSADGGRYATTISEGTEVPKQLVRFGKTYTTILSMAVTTERTRFAAQWVKGQ